MGNKSPVEIELQYRIDETINDLPIFKINNGLEEKRANRCLALAGAHYSIGLHYSLLGKKNEAEQHFSLCIPLIKKGLSYLPREEKVFQYSLFRYALLLKDLTQVDESAKVISVTDIDIFRLYTHPAFDHVLAHLWLENDTVAEKLIQVVRNIESKKQELYLFPGVAKALTSVVENNVEQLAKDLDYVLLQHFNFYAKYKYTLNVNQLICEPAIFISIIANKRGMNVKSLMQNYMHILLLKPADQNAQPILKKKGRVEFQTDLMPEFVLARWAT